MVNDKTIIASQRSYFRYSSRHKWHTKWSFGCMHSRRDLKSVEGIPEAQILYGMLYTRPPGDFCKKCFKNSHFLVAETIEDCR